MSEPKDVKDVPNDATIVTPDAPKAKLKGETKVEPSKTELLLELLAAREGRLALAEQAAENARIQREKQRNVNATHHAQDRLKRQINCKHLKGTSGPKSAIDDFAVFLHTFIDGDQVIKCFICGMRWKKDDSVEFLVRDGRRIPNHTRIGWREANNMLSHSTNKPSSSEIPMTGRANLNSNGPSPELAGFEAQ